MDNDIKVALLIGSTSKNMLVILNSRLQMFFGQLAKGTKNISEGVPLEHLRIKSKK